MALTAADVDRIDNNLIFDIGFYDGSDSRYYLDKGFRVVAVEADPRAVVTGRRDFAKDIEAGRLTLVPKAIWKTAGDVIPFYLNPGENSSWHSVYRWSAERDDADSIVEQVETVTVPMLFEMYGVPRYLKCDIEDADEIVVEQIGEDSRLPAFVSTEFFEPSVIDGLRDAGYNRFQLVNQGHLSKHKPPRPAREGQYAKVTFDGAYSGLFGLELPEADWVDYETCMRRFVRWKAMKQNYGTLPRLYKHIGRLTGRGWLDCTGWMDIHATTTDTLGRSA